MTIFKKLTVFVGVCTVMFGMASGSSAAGNDATRYVIHASSGFARRAIGNVRHDFGSSFTADLSPFQLKIAKMLKFEVEEIPVFQISVPPKNKPTVRLKPTDQTPWGIEYMYDDATIASTSGGMGIRVAILDTGIASHPDLKNSVIVCKDFTNARQPIINGCEDRNGHGTHVAGIVAANGGEDKLGIYGVAPGVKLLVYKVCGDRGTCYGDDIAMAIRTAVDTDANLISMSLGSSQPIGLIRDALAYATSKNVLPIAAAGNSGPFPASIEYPGAYASVVAVGAIQKTGIIADWSSRGINATTDPAIIEEKDIELVAPGDAIESTWRDGGYEIISGTSMATPFITGLAAKIWSFTPDSTASEIREALRALIQSPYVPDDNAYGFGSPQVP